jgi:putative peptidoglycan lipid II flippase
MALATAFAYWCLPQILFYALYSLLSEVLNARKVFGPFTWAPALNNIVAMTGLVAFNYLFPDANTGNSMEWNSTMVLVLAGSATAGVAAQASILLAFWKRAGLSFKPDFAWKGVGLGKTGKAALWIFGMIVVTQIAGIVQANVATLPAGGDAPSLAILRISWGIFMLPHSVVAVSLATAYFTQMATYARDKNLPAVRKSFTQSISRIGLFMVIATVGLIVVSLPLTRPFGGALATMQAMAWVISFYALGLTAFSVLFVIQRVFYALEDTRTPFFLQLVHASLFISMALFVSTLPLDQIAFGLALSASIAGSIQTTVAVFLLRVKLGGLDLKALVVNFLRYALAALPASAVGVAIVRGFNGPSEADILLGSSLNAALIMVLITIAMVITYALMLWLLRNQEFLQMARSVGSRLGRSKSGNTSS